MEPNPKHHQDHPDFGQLLCGSYIGHKARRKGAYEIACKQISHNGRKLNFLGNIAKYRRKGEPKGEQQDDMQAFGDLHIRKIAIF